MYLVESSSGRVIWSFSTGSPVYHSYQASPVTINTSGVVECGDDWELILHHNRFGKKRLSETIADYVALTPIITEDGVVILGSKRSTVFEVDAKTGRVIRRYAAADFDGASKGWSDDGKNVTTSLGIRSNELADPANLSSTEFLLKIFRTDYFLQSVGPKSGMILCTMAVAEFKAVLLCQPNKNPSSGASLDAEGQYASDSGLDFAMPYACDDEKLKEVYRQQKDFLLEPKNPGRFSGDYQESDMLPMPSSDLMLPPQANIDGFLPGPDSMMLFPAPAPNYLPSLLPKIDFCHSNDDAAMLPPLPMERIASEKVDLGKVFEWSAALPLILFVVFLLGSFIFYQHKVKSKNQNRESNLKCPPSKKKRKRKSGKNTITVDQEDRHLSSTVIGDRQDNHLSSTEEDVMTNKVDERRIGKLSVLNKEIAKGSNGTIVLEGSFDNRKVAVKRLVRAHHKVADKEIQILKESDSHPNIVRLYGVEFDQDFIYLALERCSCSLDYMIQKYSGNDNTHYLWKANDYPSSLLLQLMRDVVSGLVHLHGLGIIHRDLKPHNVLIADKKESCAKLSDMGISKLLPENVSSVDHSATGCGSSGWQAPELLNPEERQTRSVDLFSLGCVLFFCITGGRHPYGDHFERDMNILKDQKDLFLVDFFPEAKDLISGLLNYYPNLRPSGTKVLHHPMFWSSEKRLSFLRDTSDRVELEDRVTHSNLQTALENIASVAFNGRWDKKLDRVFLNNIGQHRRYKFNSVRDLLRVIRNKLNHYGELPQGIQELVGPVPEGFDAYFASKFPMLLIEVHKVIYKYCKEDDCFQRYF